jgi:hypothetical protein
MRLVAATRVALRGLRGECAARAATSRTLAVEERRLSESAKKTVAYRQQYACAVCAVLLPPAYEVDHIQPLALGGSNGLGNLQALCKACHATKTRKDITDIEGREIAEAASARVEIDPLPWAATDSLHGACAESEESPLSALNDEQVAAVRSVRRAFKLKAGPGTGKTRVLTARAQLLVEERSVSPMSILGLTFTNRAANEMRTRLDERLGSAVAEQLTLGTFHSVALRILRQDVERFAEGRGGHGADEWSHDGDGGAAGASSLRGALESAERAGWWGGDPHGEMRYTRSFVVFDGQDSQHVCARLVKDSLSLDAAEGAGEHGRLRPAAVQRSISFAKNAGIDARAFAALVELRCAAARRGGRPQRFGSHGEHALIGAEAIESAFNVAAARARAAPTCRESAAVVASLRRAAHLALGAGGGAGGDASGGAHRGVEWLGLELNQLRHLADLFCEYETALLAQNALDYDDLLLVAGRLLREHSDGVWSDGAEDGASRDSGAGGAATTAVRRKYREIFRHILVDEYQDTNALQVRQIYSFVCSQFFCLLTMSCLLTMFLLLTILLFALPVRATALAQSLRRRGKRSNATTRALR